MRSLGIDIGHYSIKVVEILGTGRSYQVSRSKEYKILNPEIKDQDIDIIQTLAQIAKEFETENAKVVVPLRQQSMSTRKLSFPFKERAKIHKSLAFELEDEIPLPIEKAIYDSRTLRFHGRSAEFIAMACLSEEVEETLDLFERGKIDPDILTPEFTALANFYEKWDRPPVDMAGPGQNPLSHGGGGKMLVHMGHARTFVGVIDRGALIWGRSVQWGAEQVIDHISKAFQVPFTAAQEMIPTKAFVLLTSSEANQDQVKMSETVTQSLIPLVRSLRLTMMLALTDHGVQVEDIELMGPPSQIKNMGTYLTQQLECSANPVNPVLNLDSQIIKRHEHLGDSFQIALGLAIEGLRRPSNPPVNFRQMAFVKKNQSFQKFWEKWGYTAKIVAAGYLCFLIYGMIIESMGHRLEESSHELLLEQAGRIAQLKGANATHGKIREYIKRNQKKGKLVKMYGQLEEINSPIKFIHEVSQILPRNKKDKSYEIRKFVVKDSKVSLQGVANSSQTIKKN